MDHAVRPYRCCICASALPPDFAPARDAAGDLRAPITCKRPTCLALALTVDILEVARRIETPAVLSGNRIGSLVDHAG